MIYLDNAATTKMFEECADVYKDYACKFFYNPSASYRQGIENSDKLDEVRKIVLEKLGTDKGDVIFTSGATESNNLAIRGSLRSGKWEYIFSLGEHASVNSTALELQEKGYIVHFVPLLDNGQVDYDAIERLLNDKTRLISVIHVSNETGAINDLKRLSQMKKVAKNALLHIDGVQAFCKIPFRLDDYDVDFYSFSAHKFHGPKGVGALYVKNKNELKSIIFGGQQEYGKRSGTQNLPAIMAMNCALNKIDIEKNFEHTKSLNAAFLEEIRAFKNNNISIFGEGEITQKISQNASQITSLNINQDKKQNANQETRQHFSPYIISLSFKGVNGETLMRALENDVIVATGSACSSKLVGNRVLENVGYSKDRAKSSIRVSFNAYMSEAEVRQAAKKIVEVYDDIWKKVK